MDDTRVAEIRARLEAATSGPWVAATSNGRKTGYGVIGRAGDRGTGKAIAVFAGISKHRNADAQLCAHAPADLADLLDERKLLLAVVEAADEYESVLGRFGIDVSGPLTRLCAAVRAYRTGEAGQ